MKDYTGCSFVINPIIIQAVENNPCSPESCCITLEVAFQFNPTSQVAVEGPFNIVRSNYCISRSKKCAPKTNKKWGLKK